MDTCDPDGLALVAVTSALSCHRLQKHGCSGTGIGEMLKEGKDASTRGFWLEGGSRGLEPPPCCRGRSPCGSKPLSTLTAQWCLLEKTKESVKTN